MANKDLSLLLRVVTQFAEKQLTPAGILPFGAALGCKRDIQLLLPDSMKPDARMDELDFYWKGELGKKIAAGECRAVCYCVDLRVKDLEAGTQVPALFIHAEHCEGEAEDAIYAYTIASDSKVVLGTPSIEPSTRRIFAS